MFCIEPFSGLSVTTNGDVFMCCFDWLPMPVGNILETPLMDIWKGKRATDLRVSIIDRSFRFCKPSCPFLANPRGPVMRGRGPSSPLPLTLIHRLTLSYDPTCNLECPSCRTSTLGKAEKTDLIHDKIIHSDILKRVKLLYLSGYGDPVASPRYWSLLRNLESLPINPDLTVRLHTNGLLLTPEKWEKLGSSAKRITNISISIDAASEKTYKLNRGGSWQQLHENLAFISKLPGIRLEMNFVVQTNNFREMPDFVEMAFKYSVQHIFFAGIRNWESAWCNGDRTLILSDVDHQNRAVHLPSHPQHAQLIETLKNPILKDPRVLLADFLS